jgi:hypothetical protein
MEMEAAQFGDKSGGNHRKNSPQIKLPIFSAAAYQHRTGGRYHHVGILRKTANGEQ